jgi:hypothetical protein
VRIKEGRGSGKIEVNVKLGEDERRNCIIFLGQAGGERIQLSECDEEGNGQVVVAQASSLVFIADGRAEIIRASTEQSCKSRTRPMHQRRIWTGPLKTQLPGSCRYGLA